MIQAEDLSHCWYLHHWVKELVKQNSFYIHVGEAILL